MRTLQGQGRLQTIGLFLRRLWRRYENSDAAHDLWYHVLVALGFAQRAGNRCRHDGDRPMAFLSLRVCPSQKT